MTRQETMMILKMLKLSYRVSFIKVSPQDMEVMLNLWTSQLKDESAEDVNRAVQEHINTSKYMPTVADIKERIKNYRSVNSIEYDGDPDEIKALQKLCMGYQEVIKKCDAEQRTPTNADFKPYKDEYEKEKIEREKKKKCNTQNNNTDQLSLTTTQEHYSQNHTKFTGATYR